MKPTKWFGERTALVFGRILSVLLIAVLLVGTVAVSATDQEVVFEDHDFKITAPDGTLVMDKKTNKNAAIWLEAGISDSEDRLEMMEQMNVLSLLFDKNTGALVNVICKMTEETVNMFTFVGKSDGEILDYVDKLMEGVDAPDENGQSSGVTYERSLIKHNQIPFFKILLDIKNEEMTAKEVIYGCVVNGRLIEIDQYLEGEGDVDESFIGKIVDSVRITKFMTREEYEQIISKSKIKIWIALGCVVFLFVGLFVFVTYNKKKKEKKAARISEGLRDFRERKARGEVDCKTVIAMGSAEYNIKAIDKFVNYNTWIRNIVVEVILLAFLALIVWFCLSSGSTIYGLLVAACGLVSVYFNYSGGEKNKANMLARYDARRRPLARFTFYEEFFNMTGAGAMAEYTYDQVMSVRVYNEYLYIFFGTEQGVFVERNTIGEEELVKLITHIKTHKAK